MIPALSSVVAGHLSVDPLLLHAVQRPEELESAVRDTLQGGAESPFQIDPAAGTRGVMPPSGILA